jgi:serine/threonine protein kinase
MKACPTCHIAYPSHLVVCPHDATPLIEAGESTAPPEDLHPALKFLKTRVSLKKTCPKCHGVYPADLYKCTQDGASLLWLIRWTAGDLIKAKSVCSMREADGSLRVTSGEYRVLALVDENDSCLVFKALELDSGRERDLVTPNMDLTLVPQDAGMTRGFEVFVQALIEWTSHRNENLLEIGSLAQMDDGRLFFVLDLEEGRRLAEVIRQEAPLPPLRACALARQIACGLGALHAGGMIHGGAVPKNILVAGSPGAERIKVLPLGLPKLYDAWYILNLDVECIPFKAIDYLGYQAPDKKCDARADLYTLGTVLYEMLTGSRSQPSREVSYVEYLKALATWTRPPLPIAVAHTELKVPKNLESLVMRLLERDPSRRPANAQEVINEITQVEAEIQRPAALHPSPALVTPASSPRKDSKVSIAGPGSGTPRAKIGPWAEGQIIRGKYRILHWLCVGDLGICYKALRLQPEILRVIEIATAGPLDDSAQSARIREIFQQSAREYLKLQHPNVVCAVEVDEAEDGRLYMVREYLEKGRSLEQVMKQEGRLVPLRACAIARQVAAGLGAAHALGVVHGEVCPLTVWLLEDPEGEKVKLLEFGTSYVYAAIQAESPKKPGACPPRPYGSPEQMRGEHLSDLDGRSDLFSLGTILYLMLTGEKPFPGENLTAVAYMILTQQPKPIRTVRPDLAIPDSLANLVMRCLEKDRDLRPANAGEVIRAIERAEREIQRLALSPPPWKM